MILRDDHDDVWTDEADATLDRRVYYCQNWRADVVAILAANGRLIERAWYEPYGTPHASSNGDFSGDTDPGEDHYLVPDGIVDADDQYTYLDLFNAPNDLADMTGSTDPGDPDYGRPDGMIDASDFFFWLDCNGAADDLGRNVLSEGHTGASLGTFSVRNRKGLAGYEWDPAINKYHVRNRVLDPDTGRWTRRDPLGYVDGMGLFEYGSAEPITTLDPMGLDSAKHVFRPQDWIDPTDPQCKKILSRCRTDPKVMDAIRRVNTHCSVKGMRINLDCKGGLCDDPSTLGYFCCPKRKKVVICVNNNPGLLQKQCETLAHELTHAADYCEGRHKCWYGFFNPCGSIPGCGERACAEVRAYARSGECCTGTSLDLQCVADQAKVSSGCSKKDVDKAMANPNCVSGTECMIR